MDRCHRVCLSVPCGRLRPPPPERGSAPPVWKQNKFESSQTTDLNESESCRAETLVHSRPENATLPLLSPLMLLHVLIPRAPSLRLVPPPWASFLLPREGRFR